MSKQHDALDEVLGIADVVENSIEVVTPPKPVLVPKTEMNDADIDNDYKYQRENFYNLVAEVTEKLGDLQSKMKKLKEVPNSAPKNVTNALFVGSTAELQKMLKGKE
jgi:hypothetical protein